MDEPWRFSKLILDGGFKALLLFDTAKNFHLIVNLLCVATLAAQQSLEMLLCVSHFSFHLLMGGFLVSRQAKWIKPGQWSQHLILLNLWKVNKFL